RDHIRTIPTVGSWGMKMNWKSLSAAVLGICLLVTLSVSQERVFSPYVSAQGDISLPADFRTGWTHLGSWGLKDGMHDVYTYADTVTAFQETGKFPDGAVLVKEVRGHREGVRTTGDVQWGGDIVQWFVMVKDTENRFPENPLWADGWGWALFKPADRTKQLATSYQKDCMACHIPAAHTDRVYVEGYPMLREK
ncbi:MAG: cytochrome P460 family protein, partial [Verrucomicrobiales bacterium]|nr:cytochrome P460 family protein [Verrucomicrobiales bacterium]